MSKLSVGPFSGEMISDAESWSFDGRLQADGTLVISTFIDDEQKATIFSGRFNPSTERWELRAPTRRLVATESLDSAIWHEPGIAPITLELVFGDDEDEDE